MMASNQEVTVRIRRFDPEAMLEPVFASYRLPYEPGLNVLRILSLIYEEQDHTLAFKHSCRIGFCSACRVHVNGKPLLACRRIVQPGEELVIEPARGGQIVRDLVIEVEP